MNLFELTLKFNGFPITAAKRKCYEIQQIADEKYEEYVKNARREIVDYHLKNNSFYKNFVGSANLSVWKKIPILKKSDLQIPLKQRFSEGFSEKNCYVNKTSGSSGTPFIFTKDKFCHAMSWAEIMDRYKVLGIDFSTTLEARFYGIPLDFKGYYKERFKDFLSSRFRFPIFDLSDEKMEQFLHIFRRKKFYYINGYTSSLVYFARFLKKKNLILAEVCPSLNYCIVTSEMLFEDDKELMEEVFGIPIINEYGASEFGLIAFTNNNYELVVNSESLFIEILDAQDNPVAYGNPGRVIITSFYNKAHPMIRYDIGDIGILSDKSTFKKPILEKIIGRTNDMAILPSGKTVPGLVFYYVTKKIIGDTGNVKEFIIEQVAMDSFKIKYVSTVKLNREEISKIESALYEYLEKELKLQFERVEIIKRSNRGKLKQFISSL